MDLLDPKWAEAISVKTADSGSKATAAMALIQAATVLGALLILLHTARSISGEPQW